MPPITTTDQSAPVSGDHALVLAALERFYSVASFYPVDHSKCREAMVPFFAALEKVVAGDGHLYIEPHAGSVCVNGQPLAPDSPGASLFFELLDALGVQRLNIQRRISDEDLHSTVCTLNARKLDVSSAVNFQSLDLSGLPKTVEAVRREFGWGRFKLGGSNNLPGELSAKLDDLAERIDQLPWDDVRKQEFRLKTEAFLARTIETMDRRRESQFAQSATGHRSLEDVLILGASAISHAIGQVGTQADSVNLQKLFRNAAESLSLAADTDSVEIMLEILNETVGAELMPEDDEPVEELMVDTTVYAVPVSGLLSQIPESGYSADDFPVALGDMAREMRAIRIQLLASGVSEKLTHSLTRDLRNDLQRPLPSPMVNGLIKAVARLLSEGDRRPIDRLLPIVLHPLARFSGERLAVFLKEDVGQDRPDRLALIWPHLVGLLLKPKPPANADLRRILVTLVGHLSEESLDREAHRLDLLPETRNGQLGPALLLMNPRNSGPALRALLTGRLGTKLGTSLQQAWLKRPPFPLAEVLARCLGDYESGHRPLYSRVLADEDPATWDKRERAEAADPICRHIASLESSQRKEAWVPLAIEELGRLKDAKSRPILKRILQEKRLGLISLWPAPCRKQADTALQLLSEGDAS